MGLAYVRDHVPGALSSCVTATPNPNPNPNPTPNPNPNPTPTPNQVLFLVCNGPLAWSVLAFAQSLVFHSHAHMTSVFVHVSPMLLTYAIRWRHGPTADHEVFSGRPFAVCDGVCDEGPLQLLGNALLYFYVPRVVLEP